MLSLVKGFLPGDRAVLAGDLTLGASGTCGIRAAARIRSVWVPASRVCLAGELAHINADTIGDFALEAAGDVVTAAAWRRHSAKGRTWRPLRAFLGLRRADRQ